MLHKISATLVALLTAVTLWGQDSLLTAKIGSLIASLPEGSEVGICAYDLTASRPLFCYRENKLSRPASTMKLLTVVTALDSDKAERPFTTRAYTQGIVENDTLRGDIYVVGGFDPQFDDAAMNSLVAQIASQPFHVVRGIAYGDTSMKDNLYWGHGWAWDDNPDYYQPYLSPLMFAKGTVRVTARPAAKGEAAQLTCTPRSTYYRLANNTRSKTPSAGEFSVDRDWLNNDNTVVVSGNVPAETSGTINLYSSQDFFMHTLVERLAERGVTVIGGYSYSPLPTDSGCTLVATFETPLMEVAIQLMKKSDNLNSEALLWRIGAQANEGKSAITAADGLKEVNRMIQRAGQNPGNFKIADGCGLSNYDYLSPQLLVDVLRYAYSKTSLFRQLYRTLPVAGVDGTLRGRMKSGKGYRNVHAKTGSYTAINALTGYLKRDDGHDIAFAIMNQNCLSASAARQFQDRVCEELIGSRQ
jgi:D-alanyl-D-alanine carboxypeptidase/D-alanyl-D-alanine-endopeptidase (penicillin-binding protein 4)